jgi:hypothetical protein
LRKQLREAEQRASDWEQARKEAAESVLEGLGFPKLAKTFLTEVKEFPTPARASAFLEGLGLAKAESQPEQSQGNKPEADSKADEVAKVADLGQKLAASTAGTDKTLLERINAARTPQELSAAMAEAGALTYE